MVAQSCANRLNLSILAILVLDGNSQTVFITNPIPVYPFQLLCFIIRTLGDILEFISLYIGVIFVKCLFGGQISPSTNKCP